MSLIHTAIASFVREKKKNAVDTKKKSCTIIIDPLVLFMVVNKRDVTNGDTEYGAH